MKLAVFDIDGTLCATNDVDDRCFCGVVVDMLGLSLEPNWDSFPHVTDSGILDSLWRQHRARAPAHEEREAFIDAYVAALESELAASPELFREVRGSASLLAALSAAGWRVAIATGGWRRTAQLKLKAAGLPIDSLHATANDAHERTSIFGLAQRLADPDARCTDVVLIGDGTWDLDTARQLGWRFVGVATGSRATKLHASGARVVVPDFADLDSVLAHLTSPIVFDRIWANQARGARRARRARPRSPRG
jgi:phosphoglycolate phosphatase-like HAD superfamily hydrolase